ncbi:MAG: hypothetical protein DLM59_14095 [Pseudonocardiales bacterium]|nr:MAG: hypothetical protein DLM59_14095 [Pseudonocardiales bacterium]
MTAVDIPTSSIPIPDPVGPVTVGGAASRRLSGSIDGLVRAAMVRAAFPSAVYLDTGKGVVAVVAHDGLRLPISVVVAATSTSSPFAGVRPGDPATVGGGKVTTMGLEVTVGRWWTPPRPPALVRPEHLPARAARLARILVARRRALADPVAGRLVRLGGALRARRHVGAHPASLVGLGEGLTPAGDDVLAGVLLALRHLGRPDCADLLWAAIAEEVPRRTTALSATLLAAAAAGDAAPQVVEVLSALAGHRALEPALDRLLAVGSTSGSDIAHGLLAGATGP